MSAHALNTEQMNSSVTWPRTALILFPTSIGDIYSSSYFRNCPWNASWSEFADIHRLIVGTAPGMPHGVNSLMEFHRVCIEQMTHRWQRSAIHVKVLFDKRVDEDNIECVFCVCVCFVSVFYYLYFFYWSYFFKCFAGIGVEQKIHLNIILNLLNRCGEN